MNKPVEPPLHLLSVSYLPKESVDTINSYFHNVRAKFANNYKYNSPKVPVFLECLLEKKAWNGFILSWYQLWGSTKDSNQSKIV